MTIDSLRFPFEKKIKKNLDIIFIDPPFRKNYLEKAFNLILDKDFVNSETFISCEIEKEKEIESILLHWNLIKSKVSGQSRYCLFKRK